MRECPHAKSHVIMNHQIDAIIVAIAKTIAKYSENLC